MINLLIYYFRAYEQLAEIGNRSIDPFTFQRYGGGHPRTLYNVFTIQCLTRKGIVGEDFWEDKTLQRAHLNPGLHISVYSLLGRSNNKKKMKSNINKSSSYQTSSVPGLTTGPQRYYFFSFYFIFSLIFSNLFILIFIKLVLKMLKH